MTNPVSSARKGFTIIELVVTLGVVLLLAGLTLSVTVAVVEQSERRQTAATLALLEAAVREWELTADRKLTWWQPAPDGSPGLPYAAADVHFDTHEVLIISEILDTVGRSAPVRSILADIDPQFVHTYRSGEYPAWIDSPTEKADIDERFDGSMTVLDAWGQPIYATHPGRRWTAADATGDYPRPADPDGTIMTRNEWKYGVAPNRQVVFVSAGPDGDFGFEAEFLHLMGWERHEAVKAARKDNVYSTPVTYPSYN